MTSPAEHEAALCQIEHDPPDILQSSDNIREERWTHFSLEGSKLPTATVDVIQRREALAIFERDLIIHFQQISKAAALYARALLGGIKTLEVYRRVDDSTSSNPWSIPTTEGLWHSHAEGVLMVALTNMNCATRGMAECETPGSCSQFMSADTSRCKPICDTGDHWSTKLEASWQKIDSDWWKTTNSKSTTPIICQNPE